jgi:hypothetical protein
MKSFRVLAEAAAEIGSAYVIDESRRRIAHAKATNQAVGHTIAKTLRCIERSLKRLQDFDDRARTSSHAQRLQSSGIS